MFINLYQIATKTTLLSQNSIIKVEIVDKYWWEAYQGIIGVVVGAIIPLFIIVIQNHVNNKSKKEDEKNKLRPFLVIQDTEVRTMEFNKDEINEYSVVQYIKNIGEGAALHVEIRKETCDNRIFDDFFNLGKGEKINRKFSFSSGSNGDKYILTYYDILQNRYQQVINLSFVQSIESEFSEMYYFKSMLPQIIKKKNNRINR